MSEFLDEVLAAQSDAGEPSPRRPRRVDEGLSGSAKRYAMLLALLVSLTAVPTWIMLRVGADELNQRMAVPVRPVLPLHPPQPTEEPVRVPVVIPEPVISEPAMPVVPPAPTKSRKPKVLERSSTVDTPPRRHRSARGTSAQPGPCAKGEEPPVRCREPDGRPARPCVPGESRCHKAGGAPPWPAPCAPDESSCGGPGGVNPRPVEPPVMPSRPDDRPPFAEPPAVELPDTDPPEIDLPLWHTSPCAYLRDSARRAFSYPASTRRTGSTT